MSGPSKCPLCGKPAAERFQPFCSRRCADLDLGRWLKGGYIVPGRPEEEVTPKLPPDQVPEEEE